MRIKKRYFIAILVLLFLIMAFLSPGYLSHSKPVESDTLVLEGWISDYSFHNAARLVSDKCYKCVITTGGPTPEDAELLYNGAVLINCHKVISENQNNITIAAYGTEAGDENAHFKIYVNNRYSGNSYVNTKLASYTFEIPKDINVIHSIRIEFDNDYFVTKKEDRNLYLHTISVGEKNILIRNSNNYIINGKDSVPIFETFAERAKYYLARYGVDQKIIFSIGSEKVKMERTLLSAKTVALRLKNHNIFLTKFNLFSQGIHARRSWLAYRIAFGKTSEVGLISAQDPAFTGKWWTSAGNIPPLLKELTGNIYYQVILFFN